MLISISMTKERKLALEDFEQCCKPVAEHIAKIYIHQASVWDDKWCNDIQSFVPELILNANNVKGSKNNKLSESVISSKFSDMLYSVPYIADRLYSGYSNKKASELSKLKKSCSIDTLWDVWTNDIDYSHVVHDLTVIIHSEGKGVNIKSRKEAFANICKNFALQMREKAISKTHNKE